ncbi:hypothetical protein niasHS_012372 [Heterodera schachtii]|uniref:Fibronectin type-III domain-containing protein n=1 Tax=Heterodera schachtii TaxID=97005 RepID=A0ABD2IP35_HETSC
MTNLIGEEEAPTDMQRSSSETCSPNRTAKLCKSGVSLTKKDFVKKEIIVLVVLGALVAISVLLFLFLLFGRQFSFEETKTFDHQNAFDELEKNILAKLEQMDMKLGSTAEGWSSFLMKSVGIGIGTVIFLQIVKRIIHSHTKKGLRRRGQFLFRMTDFKAFSQGNGPNEVKSDTIGYINGMPWQIAIQNNGANIGLFLHCSSLKILIPFVCRWAAFRLSIVSSQNCNECVKQKGKLDDFDLFDLAKSNWGWSDFAKFEDLMDPDNGIYDAKEDAVTFKAESPPPPHPQQHPSSTPTVLPPPVPFIRSFRPLVRPRRDEQQKQTTALFFFFFCSSSPIASSSPVVGPSPTINAQQQQKKKHQQMTRHHHQKHTDPSSSPSSSFSPTSSSSFPSSSITTKAATAVDDDQNGQFGSYLLAHKCRPTIPESKTTKLTKSKSTSSLALPSPFACTSPKCRRLLLLPNRRRFLFPSGDSLIAVFLIVLLALILSYGNNAKNASASAVVSPPFCPSSLQINISFSLLRLKNSAEGQRNANGAEMPLYLIMEYWPPHGQPPSPFTLHGPTPTTESEANFTIRVNGTWPAVRYHYSLSAVYENNGRRIVTEGNGTNTANTVLLQRGTAHSSPDKPVLVSVAATERACTLAWAPPPALRLPQAEQQQQNYAYYMEYFPFQLTLFSVASSNVVFYARTKANSVRLRRLRTGTQYRLALYAEYFGVRSLCPLELAFRTRRTVPSRYGNTTAVVSAALNATNNPMAISRKSSTPISSLFHRNTTVMSRLSSPKSEALSIAKNNALIDNQMTTSTTTTSKTSATTSLPFMATSSSSSAAKTAPRGQESIEMEESGSVENHGDTKTVVESEESSKESDNESDGAEEAEDEEAEVEEAQPVDKASHKESRNETREEPSIRMRQHGTRTLAIAWRVPELVACDAFLVRHRPLGTANGRIGTQRTVTPQALLPLVANACVEVNVSCLFENAVSPQWNARRVLDLRTPAPVQSVRVIRSYTDEYFQASVLLGFGLPPKADSAHFQLHEVHIAWSLGKKVVGRQQVVFRGEHIQKTGGKSAEGRVNITGLEPARLYTFAVRNVSRELPAKCSAPLGVRLITPPVITSTMYAGQISTHSININFGESDSSHPFDQYELHFDSSSGAETAEEDGETAPKNGKKLENGDETPNTLIRRLAKNDTKSFTFNKLVPGKTYTFALFTLLHGVRSRPVDVNITTYPLKVSAFRPLIGSGYVRLFWTVRNDAHNLCRFRLSYTASAGLHLHSALSLELNGSAVTHRFSGLDWNTFYTFTITVIMGPSGAEAESESEAVTIGMANRPRSTPQLKRYGSRELLLSFENDPEAFPDRNGALSEFAVIVAERATLEGTAGDDDATEDKKETVEETQNSLEILGDVWELPSWHDARERADDAGDDGTPWIAYRTSPSNFNPFARRTSHRIAQFVIGSEDCVPGRRRLDEMYCNGPLRANVDYFVRVRAFSVAGVAMETAWVGIDGAVPHAASKSPAEQKQQWRLPCYMYLNGCYASRERGGGSNAAARRIATSGTDCWLLLLAVAIAILPAMIRRIVLF